MGLGGTFVRGWRHENTPGKKEGRNVMIQLSLRTKVCELGEKNA